MSAYWRLVLALALVAAMVWTWILSGGDQTLLVALLICGGGYVVHNEIEARS